MKFLYLRVAYNPKVVTVLANHQRYKSNFSFQHEGMLPACRQAGLAFVRNIILCNFIQHQFRAEVWSYPNCL